MKQINLFKGALLSAVFAVFGLQQSQAQMNIAPSATVSASTCLTGPCSTLNDLNLGSCGTQSMWISTSSPPSSAPGVNWIQWDWTSTKTFNELVIHHAQNNTRFLSGFTLQKWDGTAWITEETISGLTPACISNVKLSKPVSAARFRITSFQMTTPGQTSNPNFREIEVIEAILGANNAAVAGLDSPKTFCAGTENIIARIANRGINQLNSVIVNWRYNGITQTPVSFTGLLDTNGGSGPTDTAIFLGTRTFAAGVKQSLEVWTSMPNGVADTINQDDSLITDLQPSLSGTFTIDPSGSGSTNFLTFTDAVNDLNAFGVCGPVTIDVKDGSYNEQIQLEAVAGASATNTITFRADANNTAPVLLTFAASTTDNYVVNFNGSEYVTFDGINMTNNGFYGTTVRFESAASNNSVMNATLTGAASSSTSTLYSNVFANGSGFENNSLINDTIIGGSIGIYYYSGSSTVLNPGFTAEGNYIQNSYYMGMYLYGTTGANISGNTFISQATYGFGRAVYSLYGGAGMQVNGNQILNNNAYDWPYYGLMIYYNYDATETNRARIANNMIHMGTPASSGFKYGLYAYGNFFTDVIYNNVAIETSQSSSRALYQWLNGIGCRTYNNNFLMYNNGYTVYTTSSYAPNIDNNNLASNSTLAYFNTNNTDLAAFMTAGGGANSISADSIYTNLDSMRTCDTAIFAKGFPIADYAKDFDGDNRNPVAPNIGADEFVASAEVFTIGDTIEFCGGDSLVLGTTMNGATFLWSNSATTPTITVTTEGNYSVIVNGPCATGMTDDVEVIDVNPVASFSVVEGDFIRGFNNNSEYGASYMWDFGDGSTSTQENPFHQYAENGVYQVTLTVMNYCDTVSLTQTVGITVGVNEITFGSNISIYPNPANDFFNIAVGDIEDQTVQMELVDMKGQVYANRLMKITKGSVEQIDISSLSKGVYLVRLTTDSEVATKQIIVQ